MIYIPRGPAPNFFDTKETANAFKQREEFYSTLGKLKGQSRYEDKYYSTMLVRVRPNLTEQFKHKCCYCESPVIFGTAKSNNIEQTRNHTANVETFRTLSNAMNLDGSEDAPYYWWLAYEWRNYYLSCQECNTFKKKYFPVEGKRANIKASYDELLQERYLLVDPCQPGVHLHFDFKSDGQIIPRSEKGEVTIKLLNLNRSFLLTARKEMYEKTFAQLENLFINYTNIKAIQLAGTPVSDLQNAAIVTIEFYLSIIQSINGLTYHAVQRQALRDFLMPRINEFRDMAGDYFERTAVYNIDESMAEFHADLFYIGQKKKRFKKIGAFDEYVESNIGAETFNRRIFLLSVEMQNFKSFSNLSVNISRTPVGRGEPWLLFLGENGVGKSTITQGIALALAGSKYLNTLKLDVADFLKDGEEEGFFRVYAEGVTEPFEIKLNRKANKITSNIKEPATYVSGYGSTRLLPIGKITYERSKDIVKLRNMLDYSYSLTDVEEWIGKIDDEDKFNRVALTLKDLLKLEHAEVEISRENGKLFVTRYGSKTALDKLSDGYKSVIALAVDIMRTYDDRQISYENAEGVVLIDEIGTHLHPQWRMKVAGDLRRAFPNIQFIVTTHEPLCLRGLNKGEIVALLRNKDNEVIPVKDELPDPSTMRVDQLLTSEFFGLSSTLDPALEEELFYYYQLKAKETRTADEEVTYNELKAKVSGLSLLGNSRLESIYHKVAQEKASTRWTDEGKLKNTEAVNADIKTLITDLWDELDN
jgi:hypothetical protein